MNRTIDFLKNRIASFQKEIIELKRDLSSLNESNKSNIKNHFIEMIEWMDFLDILIIDINENLSSDNSNSYTQLLKTTQRLRSRMDRYFNSNSISKVQISQISNDESKNTGVKIIETQTHPSFENGTVLEVIREGYLWNNQILRKAEVITVKNN
jgi:molecular chaperone GrpE (heat shock protein)